MKRTHLTKFSCEGCGKQLTETDILAGCPKCFTEDMKLLKPIPDTANQFGTMYTWRNYQVEEYHPVISKEPPVYKWQGLQFISWGALFRHIKSLEKKAVKEMQEPAPWKVYPPIQQKLF